MKIFRAAAALILSCALMVTSAGAYVYSYNGIDYDMPDEIADVPFFKEELRALIKEAEREGMSDNEFHSSEGFDQLLKKCGDWITQQSYSQMLQNDGTPAQCEFDAATGTVLRVTNDAKRLYIPSQIDGVEVKAIAPGAVTGKNQLRYLDLPPTVRQLSQPIAVDCPDLRSLFVQLDTLVTGKLYENCPKADARALEKGYKETVKLAYSKDPGTGPAIEVDGEKLWEVDLPKDLLTGMKVFQGNGSDMNWTGSLTRAEATAILLRLTGLEEEAKAAASRRSPFTDVPDWAKGYVTLAYEKGMVKGVGADRFDPSGFCGAQEFCLMLLRLTDHREGVDYSWADSIRDFHMLTIRAEELARTGVGTPIYDTELFTPLYSGVPFSRELACALAYRALSLPMADGTTSLGDLLCAENGLSTAVLSYDRVRLTSAALKGRLPQKDLAKLEPAKENQTLLSMLFVAMDFDLISQVASKQDFTISDEIRTLTESVIAGKTSDYDKAKAICTWVSRNIAYDYDTFEGRANTSQAPDDILKNRRAICGGFSSLIRSMMKVAGIPCVSTESDKVYIFGDNEPVAHAWNLVYADDRWFPVDVTWDCTRNYIRGVTSEKEFSSDSPEYFDMNFPDFYRRHPYPFDFDGRIPYKWTFH